MRERLTGSIPDFPTTAGTGVYAAGVDLVDIDRLRLALARCGTPLLDRLFDADERAACADGTDTAVAAGLFGIKESVVKAAGGLPPGASYRDVHVGGGGPGATRPVRLAGELARWADTRRVALTAGDDPLTPGLAPSWAPP